MTTEEPPPEPGGVPPPPEVTPEAPPEPPEREPTEPVHPEPIGRPFPLGRVILGLVLVGIGVIWLLQALDVVSFSILAVLPIALIVVGISLIGMARSGRHGALITLGIILTVILTIAAGFDIRFQGGVGEKTVRPTTVAELEREYHLSMGQLVIDLRKVELSGGTRTITASVGLGQLTVRVPADAAVLAKGHAGAGQVSIFGAENDGLDVDLGIRSRDFVQGTQVLTLDLSVGLGQIEVTR